MAMPVEALDLKAIDRVGKMVMDVALADSAWGHECVPLLVCRGEMDGPVLLATAGVHGDEFEGVRAIQQAFAELDAGRLAGTFFALPICNPWAFAAQMRESPNSVDGKNLARHFPGDPAGTPTERLADRLWRLAGRLLGPRDLFVDLHSGGTRYRYVPMIGYRDIDNPALPDSIVAARAFGIPNIWRIPGHVGPFNSETARRGIPTVAAEMTGQGECAEADVQLYKEGILNLLRHRGMLMDRSAPVVDTPVKTTDWILTQRTGILESCIRLGEWVREGQTLAQVMDVAGTCREVVRAEREGQVWAVRTFASVQEGDIAFLLAHE